MKYKFAVDKKGEGWVCVFPRGKHFINKYDTVLDINDEFLSSIKLWWENSSFKKPYLDKGHEFNEKFGEFTDMRVTEAGLELYLVLNETGAELVRSGLYEYLSPTFGPAKDSTGTEYDNVIFSVSLVNYPALLVLDKIKEQIALSFKESNKKPNGGSNMELREMIAGKLKLSLAADDGSILAEIEKLLNEGATIEDLKAKIEELKNSLAEAEAAKATAEASAKTAEASLSAMKIEGLKKEAETVIDQAIKDLQYHPSLKDLKVKQYLADPEMVKKELTLLPKNQNSHQVSSTIVGGMELSVQDRKILEDAGYDLTKPEDQVLAKKFLETFGGK